MYSQVQCSRANIASRRSSLNSVRNNEAQEGNFVRTIRWGSNSTPTCLASSWVEPNKIIVHWGRNSKFRQYHYTTRRISRKVAGVPPPASNSSLDQETWWYALDASWIPKKWQRLLELISVSNYRRMQDYAAAALTVIVLQAITSQDVSLALPSTWTDFLQQSAVMDFTLSPWTQVGSVSPFGARIFTSGKTSLMRPIVSSGIRAHTPTLHKGPSIRRQGRGRMFEGLTGGVGGELMAAKASLTALQVSPLAFVTGSLTSPLASILKAGSHVDLNVLRASFVSSLNLISLCSFVVWMQRSGQLPAETPVVLSQVAFRVLIPCFLMTKVALTLSSHPAASLLFLPLVAIAQVLMGALLGKVAFRFVYGDSSSVPPLTFETTMPASSVPAAAIITSENGSAVITKVEIPLDIISVRRNAEQYMAVKKEAVITAACAFGNSFTLPLIFMTGVLAAEEASKVAGYLALFMVGWSPALWTVGYSIIATGDEDIDLGESVFKDGFSLTTLLEGFKRLMNPPLYGVLIGVLIGGTPLSHLFLPVANGSALSVKSTGAFALLCTHTAGILSPVFDAAALLGTATLAVQTIVLASSLATSLPPLNTARDSNKISSRTDAVVKPPDTAHNSITEVASCSADMGAILDSRAFWIISIVRLVAMPVIVITSTVILQCARILPVDPVYNLVLLAQSAMPSAQNLVLLSQLRTSTQRLSGVLAELLLRQYALSIVPITLWMALFLAIVKPA